ncbi:hypothetical protein [Wenzhouxiangella limi]|uniref:Uncharacterized protein n=1 Tax=Wenzhouxiangella limi TaxID=2707351 RepID=A0A845V2P4_9GAMM|nr:hypothetical protein [Wenzhouxiangella limi]NDY95516.1 hypothetical protein [Wenzhouxiangella limi]
MNLSPRHNKATVERWRMVGVVMWRGGLVFAAAYTFYWGAWRLILLLDRPAQITIGLAVALAGLGLVMVSLILERMQAAQTEGNLLDD